MTSLSERFRQLRRAVFLWLTGAPVQLIFHGGECPGHHPRSRAAKTAVCPDQAWKTGKESFR